jgi:hypothetical protein
VTSERFRGTAAQVRRALDGVYERLDPGDAVWRCTAGPFRTPVDVVIEEGPTVVVRADVIDCDRLDGPAARALALEHDGLLFGRFRVAGGAVRAEHAIIGGPTMHLQEVRIAVWAVGWAAGAYRPRWERHLAGDVLGGDLPVPRVEPRRGVEDRIASTTERVGRFLAERHGGFAHDPHWGYHEAFGSARVFVSVRHVLEVSTAVLVAAPVLSGIELTDGFALDLAAVAEHQTFGRFAYAGDRAELWAEHAVLGDDLDPAELDAAITAIARLADDNDDRLQGLYGGQRYADLSG